MHHLQELRRQLNLWDLHDRRQGAGRCRWVEPMGGADLDFSGWNPIMVGRNPQHFMVTVAFVRFLITWRF